MIPESLQVIEGSDHLYAIRRTKPSRPGYLLLVKTIGREREIITELIAQWALHGAFYLIAAGEWLPDHDDVRYSVYRYTTAIDETLNSLILARPFTCFQLLDLLMEAGRQNKPVLILDFLHLFYDADIELSLRQRVLDQCCHYTKRLSSSGLVAVLVPTMSVEAYRRFFPVLAAVADEILETGKQQETELIQGLLF
ncbi:MAG TPA: hypothetical protein VFR47_06850 [Anaerolineales bacterium]|nr:hypothetical protein [Anaerolineales bacterium]